VPAMPRSDEVRGSLSARFPARQAPEQHARLRDFSILQERMNELALFAGAGGGILGGKILGWRTRCAVEFDPFRRAALLARQRDGILEPFALWDDVRTFDGRPWRGHIDVVSGGFPCQAYSSATAGKSVADDLWPEMRRIVADVAPRYVFAENVARRAIDAAADDLEAMGYQTRCIALSAADLGADHVRPRYWLRAYADGDGEFRGPEHAEVGVLPSLRPRVWETFDQGDGVADGLASGLDGARAAGDGQVPAVAALAWRLLTGPT
jgi:DNA (cytosine-5)-methyltransferase 1